MCVCMHDTYIYTLYLQLAVPLDTKCVFAVWCWVWCRVLQCALQCVLQYMYHSTHNECRVLWSVMQRVAACCSACSSIYTTQHTISVECCWVWCSLLQFVAARVAVYVPLDTKGDAGYCNNTQQKDTATTVRVLQCMIPLHTHFTPEHKSHKDKGAGQRMKKKIQYTFV